MGTHKERKVIMFGDLPLGDQVLLVVLIIVGVCFFGWVGWRGAGNYFDQRKKGMSLIQPKDGLRLPPGDYTVTVLVKPRQEDQRKKERA